MIMWGFRPHLKNVLIVKFSHNFTILFFWFYAKTVECLLILYEELNCQPGKWSALFLQAPKNCLLAELQLGGGSAPGLTQGCLEHCGSSTLPEGSINGFEPPQIGSP